MLSRLQKRQEINFRDLSRDFKTSKKKDDSPITEADLKSNEIIKEILSQTEHTILSEEDKDDQIDYQKIMDLDCRSA